MAHLSAVEAHLDRSLRVPASFCCLQRAWIWIIWIPSAIATAPIWSWWFGFVVVPAPLTACCGCWWPLPPARWAPAHSPISSPGHCCYETSSPIADLGPERLRCGSAGWLLLDFPWGHSHLFLNNLLVMRQEIWRHRRQRKS